MKRLKIRKNIFVSTLIIVIGIFLIGLFLGGELEKYRIDDLNSAISKSELDTEGIIVESEFIDTFAENDCNLINPLINTLSKELGDIGKTLTEYDAKGNFNKKEYDVLKRKYFLLEIKAYTLRKQVSDKCDNKGNVLLFFYDVDNDEESIRQGYVLDLIVRKNENVTVFSIDREFEDPLLDTVKRYFGVEKGPAVIVNFKDKFEGFTPEIVLNEYVN
jgi:hypothetical protein